jgi:hypothetical protein
MFIRYHVGMLCLWSSIAMVRMLAIVIPHSEIAETKPPCVCPGCFIHTYCNNMINRFHVREYEVVIYYRMTLESKENYINAAANYAWDELPQASTGGEACLATVFGILLVSQTSILNSI